MPKALRLGIDIGGTFTDLVLVGDGGVLATYKLLTTPRDPLRAIIQGMGAIVEAAGAAAPSVKDVVHATTLVTNALIEQKGARTALVTTRGFRDVLEIGKEWRYDMYDLFLDAAPLLVPRPLRFEVGERTDADGRVRARLDPAEVTELVRRLPGDVQSLAVCFLHSYADPENEEIAAEAIGRAAPRLYVSLSSHVAPEVREFERFSTTVANAYVQPLVKPYLDGLENGLGQIGMRSNLYVLLSNGGIATAGDAGRFPIRIAESGPAAGALGAAFLSRHLDLSHVVSFDMGGTTAKICFVDGGEPSITSEFEVARVYRFKRGSGIPLKVPAVELLEIGAGGGSIAHVDNLGLLRVGPESAGAEPGPVCYGGGGTRPTVTDADLALGYLDPEYFLGGRMPLDVAAAVDAIERQVAKPLQLSPPDAAWGIHRIVNENMANALRVHSVERGKDLRGYTLVAFGGAGPVHACRVAEALGLARVVCPLRASVLSAMGMLTAPLSFDFVRTDRQVLEQVDWDRANELFAQMEREGRQILAQSGAPARQIRLRRSCDMRFVGQGYEVNVPCPSGRLILSHRRRLQQAFEARYRELYSRLPGHVGAEILNWRLRVAGPDPGLRLSASRREGAGQGSTARRGTRPAYFPETGRGGTAVYDRYALPSRVRISGPAILEEVDTTVIVPPGWRATVDPSLNIVIERRR